MQAIWRGAISFGLISIPVRLYSATEEKSLRFNMLHAADLGRVRFNRTCSECGADNLTKDDLVRAYEYEKGSYVTFTEDELDVIASQVETSHTVEVINFVPATQIDPIYYQRSYYLSPDELGSKAYALLRRALRDTEKVAVCKVAIRDKERLATLRVRDRSTDGSRPGVLVLETMFWPDEIREPAFPELEQSGDIRDQELQMAETLIENLTEDFRAEEFQDTYREALLRAVEAKVEGRQIVASEATEEAPEVVDIMDALQRSLEQVKARRDQRAANE